MSRRARTGALWFAILAALGAVDLGATRLGVGGPGLVGRVAGHVGATGIEAQIATDGTRQFWYAGRQLRRPLTVTISGEDAASCGRRRVVFDAGEDGAVSPRIALAAWDGSSCQAEGWWSLGTTIGIQHARATLEDGPEHGAVTFQAIARQGARIFFGGAYTPREEGWVELVDDGVSPTGLREVRPTGYFRPIVGVDFALWPSWHRVRVAVGASAREIDRYFFFGISALQGLVFGPGQEGSAVDVHAGIQLSRRDVGRSGTECAPAAFCTKRDLRFSGVTFMVSIDGASAFRSLAGAVLR